VGQHADILTNRICRGSEYHGNNIQAISEFKKLKEAAKEIGLNNNVQNKNKHNGKKEEKKKQ